MSVYAGSSMVCKAMDDGTYAYLYMANTRTALWHYLSCYSYSNQLMDDRRAEHCYSYDWYYPTL